MFWRFENGEKLPAPLSRCGREELKLRVVHKLFRNVKLSIVIICKNEERHIRACVESILNATRTLSDTEIILVDSCSSDGTLKIAEAYPISILQLKQEWRHTPAAGRLIGFRRSQGEFVMFVDGDSNLQDAFLGPALSHFEEDSKVAAICGRRKEIYWRHGQIVGEEPDINKVGPALHFSSVAPGSALYRRTALNEVGCFNPYLFAEEEAELGERLRWAGYKILGVPLDMVVHNTVPRERVSSLFRRMKHRFHLGLGQVIRYRVDKGLPARAFVSKGKRALQYLAWLTAGSFATGITVLTGNYLVVIAWLCLSGLLFLGFVAKSCSVIKPARYIVIWTIQAYSIVRGFLIKPINPSFYPTEPHVIKR
jgi:glycosyltransferase involved in cell wall biosynthesis